MVQIRQKGKIHTNDKNAGALVVASACTVSEEGQEDKEGFVSVALTKVDEQNYKALIMSSELGDVYVNTSPKEEIEPINPQKLIRKFFEIVGNLLGSDPKNPE